jgi:hypothetical protein
MPADKHVLLRETGKPPVYDGWIYQLIRVLYDGNQTKGG